MFSVTVNTGLLKKAIRVSNAFLNGTRVRISQEGIAIRAVDAGNVCPTDIFIPKEDFKSFKAEEGVHSGWCDYNCKNYSHESLCDRIHDAIVAAETARRSDCAFMVIRVNGIWCGITGECVDPNRQVCKNFKNFKRPEDMTVEEIAELNSKP